MLSGDTVKGHQKDYEMFFTIKETPKRGRKVEYNQDAIARYRKNTAGWFVLATNDRLFIQYIALILSAQIKNVMDANGWFKSHNMQEVIDEMKSLRVVFMEGKCKQVYTTLTAFQKEIVELFGLVLC